MANAHLRPKPHSRHDREQLVRLIRYQIITHLGPCTCPTCTCEPDCDHKWCLCPEHSQPSLFGDCLRHAVDVDRLAADIAQQITVRKAA